MPDLSGHGRPQLRLLRPAQVQSEEAMTPGKKEVAGPKAPSQPPAAVTVTRKAWKPKSPIDVVIGQIEKQENKVAELEKELGHERTSLNKLLQAKKVLES